MNRFFVIAGAVFVLALFILPAFLLGKNSAPESKVLARTGLHWHSQLEIYLQGQKVPIPANVGIYPTHEEPIHTHETDGTIHLEFTGLVTKNNLRLGRFFQIWGKTFNRTCLLESCSTSPAGAVKMSVNGQPNLDYENYSMKDGDKIVLKGE